ncbi:MAG: pectate lyase [Candidatus Hydrogenedentota bacterium]
MRFLMSKCLTALCVLLAAVGPSWAGETTSPSREQAADALEHAVEFFDNEVSVEGGYLWRYKADLTLREGEGKASASQAWVQPPGTPSVGMAFLRAYQKIGDPYLLEAARHSAHALAKVQLVSGGWHYSIEFNPEKRGAYAYRVDSPEAEGRNVSTLDDDVTQSALRFLMQVDQTLKFDDETIHEAVMYGLEKLFAAQYPNGAWPQRFTDPPDPEKYPVKPASYPDEWSREYPSKNYMSYYTFNDNTIRDAIKTLFDAAEIYDRSDCREAALRAGDFIILAQMPDPQPGWAQQYDADMHPAWARKFEPPAVTGGESQGVMRTLLYLYRKTGDAKYLEPLPRALDYYEKSALPDGRLARFYELRTNKPLYFTKDYQLTYSSDDMPTHYAFIVGSSLPSIRKEYERLKEMPPEKLQAKSTPSTPRLTPELAAKAQQVIKALDERGAWTEAGDLQYHKAGSADRVIDCRTFIRNVGVLSDYLAAMEE